MNNTIGAGIAGLAAGGLNGLLGAGGGMVLAPLLRRFTQIEERQLFPASVAILIPVCVISLLFSRGWAEFSLPQALPYLIGSAAGGILASRWGSRIPVQWLHRIFGALVLWGGVRYLC